MQTYNFLLPHMFSYSNGILWTTDHLIYACVFFITNPNWYLYGNEAGFDKISKYVHTFHNKPAK